MTFIVFTQFISIYTLKICFLTVFPDFCSDLKKGTTKFLRLIGWISDF